MSSPWPSSLFLFFGHTELRPWLSRSTFAWVMPMKRLRPCIASAFVCAESIADVIAGKSAPMRMPRMPITTSSSTRVNPFFCVFILPASFLWVFGFSCLW